MMQLDHENKMLIRLLWLALAACFIIIAIMNVRVVGAEDDCADPTWMVQRTAIGLLCIGEGRDGRGT
jgi:uncharacterized membrane protein